MGKVTVEQWKGLFREVGVKEEDMVKWHRNFEAKYPQGHQSFLEWLGLDNDTIKTIRQG